MQYYRLIQHMCEISKLGCVHRDGVSRPRLDDTIRPSFTRLKVLRTHIAFIRNTLLGGNVLPDMVSNEAPLAPRPIIYPQIVSNPLYV